VIGAELAADRQPVVARASEYNGLRAQRLCNRDPKKVSITGCAPSAFATATPRSPIGPGPVTTTLSPATSPPSSVSPYMAVPAVTTSVASSSDMVSGMATSVLMLLT